MIYSGVSFYLIPHLSNSFATIVIILFPLLLFTSLKFPIIALSLYFILLPFDLLLGVSYYNFMGSILKYIGGWCGFTLILNFVVRKRRKLIFRKGTLAMFIFIIWAFITLIWTKNLDKSLEMLNSLVMSFLLYFSFSIFEFSYSELKKINFLIIVGGVLASFMTLYTFLEKGLMQTTLRNTIILLNKTLDPNLLGGYLLIPFSLLLKRYFEEPKKLNRQILFILIILVAFSIFSTLSRGAIFSTALFIIILLLRFGKEGLKKLTPVFLSTIFILPFLQSNFFKRATNIWLDRGAGRLDIWIGGLRAARKYFLLGSGINTFPISYTEFSSYTPIYMGIYRGAHNIYLSILVETGIIGFILFILVIVFHYIEINKYIKEKNMQTILLASFSSILFFGATIDILTSKFFWLMFILITINTNKNLEMSKYKEIGGS